ncbi:EAL domain-containing protein, partial [Pontibacter sp. JAM-7]|uniref:EAL domain-containing protein n=1 Tax=Pontibacter sp. JAM-7 TaxID=3366581 RepID=UPI003AF6CC69
KIDRSFIQDLEVDLADRKIVQGVITMAHKLQLVVVAEGIETAAQLSLLQGYQSDMGQGYLFSKPQLPDVAFALPVEMPVPDTSAPEAD